MAQQTEAPRYRVVSAFVNAKVAGNILGSHRGGAYTIMGYYKDAILPRDVHPDDVKRLLSGGHIEALPEEVA